MQNTSHLLLIRPVHFAFNAETAVNNAFQISSQDPGIQGRALAEFDAFIEVLTKNGIDVTVVNDTEEPHTPDAIFPNNWISFHDKGIICIYPMFAHNRRLERKPDVLQAVGKKMVIRETIDLTGYESQELFLEGTGSMVLDRENRIAYACLSPRTNENVLEDFCRRMQYTSMAFHASDERGLAIYHTNVMMCVADRYVVICLESITDDRERKKLAESIRRTEKELIPIRFDQMNHFAGNMLQVVNDRNEKLLIMSSQAYASLDRVQVEKLQFYNKILHSDLGTIEKHGGGSARCMMAELFV